MQVPACFLFLAFFHPNCIATACTCKAVGILHVNSRRLLVAATCLAKLLQKVVKTATIEGISSTRAEGGASAVSNHTLVIEVQRS